MKCLKLLEELKNVQNFPCDLLITIIFQRQWSSLSWSLDHHYHEAWIIIIIMRPMYGKGHHHDHPDDLEAIIITMRKWSSGNCCVFSICGIHFKYTRVSWLADLKFIAANNAINACAHRRCEQLHNRKWYILNHFTENYFCILIFNDAFNFFLP